MRQRIRRITGLAPDPLRPGAVRVQVDGRPWGALTVDDARGAGLAVGVVLEGERGQQVAEAADAESAYRAALRALARRAHAGPDLRRRLIRRGHPAPAVDQALARAQAAKLLDDESFARQFVQSRAARGRGPGRVRRDLLALGLETTLVDRALAAAWPEEMDPTALAASLARRRAAQLGDLPRPVKARRILAYLGRRGFSGAWVGELVRRTLATGKKG